MKTQTQKLLTLAVLSAGLILGMAPEASFASKDRVLKVHTDPQSGKTIDVNQVLQYKLKLNKPQPKGVRVRVRQQFFCNGLPTRGSGLVELDHKGKFKGHTLRISRMAPICRTIGATFKARFHVFPAQGVKAQVVERQWKISDKRPTPKLSIVSQPGSYANIRANSLVKATITLQPGYQMRLRTMITCYGPQGGPTPRYRDIQTDANGNFAMPMVPINLGCNKVGQVLRLTAYPISAGTLHIKPAVSQWTINSTPF